MYNPNFIHEEWEIMSANPTELSRVLEALAETQEVFVRYPEAVRVMGQGQSGFEGLLAIMRFLSDSGDTRKVRRTASRLAEQLAGYID